MAIAVRLMLPLLGVLILSAGTRANEETGLPSKNDETSVNTNKLMRDMSQSWAILVSTVKGWDYYWAESDVCRMYHLLINRGMHKDNIIVMMADSIARNPKNPNQGVIINYPTGRNIYPHVRIDYTGESLRADVFLAVLKGDKKAVAGLGTGRVYEGGPRNKLIIAIETEGHEVSDGYAFPQGDVLTAGNFHQVLHGMERNRMFLKAVVFVQGDIYEHDRFANGVNVGVSRFSQVVMLMDRFTPKYYNQSLETSLSGVFTSAWMDIAEGRNECWPDTLQDLFDCVQVYCPSSENIGDQRVLESRLSEFMGIIDPVRKFRGPRKGRPTTRTQ